MSQGGFYEQKRLSPTGLTVVIAAHAAALAALILIKGPTIIPADRTNPVIKFVPLNPDPPPEVPPPPQTQQQPVRQQTRIDTPRPIIETPTRGPVIETPPLPPQPWTNTPPGNDIIVQPQPQPRTDPPPPPPAPPRVIEAARARGSLQGLFRPDDYPASAAESGDQGSTGVRLTINGDGRVTGCSVTRTSGSRAMDNATCSVLRSRARYTPASDQNNQPTTDTQNATITWRLSE